MISQKLENINVEIRTHMARAFFASAWADQCEESNNAALLIGCEIMGLMPAEIDPSAIQAARTLEMDFLTKNRQFSCLAGTLDWLQTVCPDGGDRERTAEMLGHYMAMQAMGHGVGLGDAFGQDARTALPVPYVEFSGISLEKDYF